VLYALAFFLFIYFFLPLQQRNLALGLLASQWVGLLGLALLYARFCHRPFPQVIHLSLPSKKAWIGAILVGCSAWIWVGALSDLILPVPKSLLEDLRRLIAPTDGSRGLVSTLFLMALTPALCEEAFFRGPLLRGFRQRLPGPSTAVITGLLFGLFHLEVYRLLPTSLLGVLLSFLALASGSILPSMLAHFCNNACLVLLAHSGWEARLQALEGVSSLLLIVPALCLTLLGIFLTQPRHEL
jgi:sodium transport system permease protein